MSMDAGCLNRKFKLFFILHLVVSSIVGIILWSVESLFIVNLLLGYFSQIIVKLYRNF